ncbi:MAG: hypothetical protein ACYSSP_04050 [Planctomycetota bacterium]
MFVERCAGGIARALAIRLEALIENEVRTYCHRPSHNPQRQHHCLHEPF